MAESDEQRQPSKAEIYNRIGCLVSQIFWMLVLISIMAIFFISAILAVND